MLWCSPLHDQLDWAGCHSFLPYLHVNWRAPTNDHRPMLGNSLDPFPSGPLYGGRARQTQAPAKPQEKVIFSLSTAMTRCFPACLAEKPALSVSSLLPARISTARGLATLSKEEGPLTTYLSLGICKQVQRIIVLVWSSLVWPGQCYPAEACKASVYTRELPGLGSSCRFGSCEVMEHREGLTHWKGAF